MKNRMSNASQEFVEFFSRVACWIWETIEKLFDIILDFLARIIELILAVMNLIFQVICFLRDLCIEAMQTFANVFRGIVNVVSNISCEEVEDFVSACIVVLLWVVAFKLVRNLLQVGILHIRGILFVYHIPLIIRFLNSFRRRFNIATIAEFLCFNIVLV